MRLIINDSNNQHVRLRVKYFLETALHLARGSKFVKNSYSDVADIEKVLFLYLCFFIILIFNFKDKLGT